MGPDDVRTIPDKKTSCVQEVFVACHENPRADPRAPPGRGLALRVVGFALPATLSGALSRPGLVYPLASFDVSGQWPVSHADASPNEAIQFGANIHPTKGCVNGRAIAFPLHICLNETLPSPGVLPVEWEDILSARAELSSQGIAKDSRRGKPPPKTKDSHIWESSLSGPGDLLSGRAELNRRPLRPERSALTGLSHAPDWQAGLYPPRPDLARRPGMGYNSCALLDTL